VITDIRHHDLDGLEFIRRLKTFCNADFIVMSGTVPEMNTFEKCFDAGASAVFKKPFKPVDLLDTIKSILKK
jgi:CheY-like chemotaxis protein